MKKNVKIILGIIGGIILLFVIDFMCIFLINKPLFAFKEDNGDSVNLIYRGLFYDTFNCQEYPMPQIKFKGTKFTCAVGRVDIGNLLELEDRTININDFACNEALESFYEDENYIYYWNCIKNKYMIAKYENGFEETISNALKYKTITISDLDKFNINYIKEEKKVKLEDVNTKIQEYFTNKNIDNSNLAYNYIDEKNNVVVVGLINNTKEKQDELIYNVFSSCCGQMYIKYIKDNSMIKFEDSKHNFEAKVISIEKNNIKVEVIKTSDTFKKGDKVIVHLNNEDNTLKAGNVVEITYNGLVNYSNPPQIGAYEIEIIK